MVPTFPACHGTRPKIQPLELPEPTIPLPEGPWWAVPSQSRFYAKKSPSIEMNEKSPAEKSRFGTWVQTGWNMLAKKPGKCPSPTNGERGRSFTVLNEAVSKVLPAEFEDGTMQEIQAMSTETVVEAKRLRHKVLAVVDKMTASSQKADLVEAATARID